ncbi:MAG: SAM-dependent methyltransferase, partial [Chloroflexota bacterium]
MQEKSQPNQTQRIEIESDQRLSESIIWQIQRAYFEKVGMGAWQGGILPHYISSNPVMASAYCQLVFGYLRDCIGAANQGEFSFNRQAPLYIIELGAGTGRLAYHFLTQFYPRWQASPFADIPIKFILTDFVEEIAQFWEKHPRFQEWVELGVLDFALFDAMDLRPLYLRHAQTTLTPNMVQNPLILFANYFFDSIPQDSFVIEKGLLCENLLSITSTQPEPDLTADGIWNRVEFLYEAIPLRKDYYEDARYNQILASYEEEFPDTVLSFPNRGLDCLHFWQGFGNGRNLILTADKGNTIPDSLVTQKDTMPKLHGSFSMMVNYHAINQFVFMNDGLVLNTPHYQDNLQVIAYMLGKIPQDGLETQQAFIDAVVHGGPDDFFALENAITIQYENMSLAQLLGFLRLSH